MTDIVIKSYKDFCDVKDQTIIESAISEKYECIFKKYECFAAKSTIQAYYGKDNKDKDVAYHKQKGYHNYNTRPREVMNRDTRIKTVKTVEKIILGIINVINHDNYMKMLNKLRMLATKDNIHVIVNEILSKCCLQVFYIKIFVKLLVDLTALSGYSEIISHEIEHYVNEFFERKEFIFNEESLPINSSNDYEIFCLKQKHKSMVLSKNALILELRKNQLTQLDLTEYFWKFYNESINESMLNDEYHYDILLQIMLDVVKTGLTLSTTDVEKMMFSDKINSKKIEFMTEELKLLLTKVNTMQNCVRFQSLQ